VRVARPYGPRASLRRQWADLVGAWPLMWRKTAAEKEETNRRIRANEIERIELDYQKRILELTRELMPRIVDLEVHQPPGQGRAGLIHFNVTVPGDLLSRAGDDKDRKMVSDIVCNRVRHLIMTTRVLVTTPRW
jgi:hypothetical protein